MTCDCGTPVWFGPGCICTPPEQPPECTHANQYLDGDGGWHCFKCEPPDQPPEVPIYDQRVAADVTLSELARRLGWSPKKLGDMEHGRVPVSAEDREQIHVALSVRVTKRVCKGCGNPLLQENEWMTDGCPCNSPAGVNEEQPPEVPAPAECTAIGGPASECPVCSVTASPPEQPPEEPARDMYRQLHQQVPTPAPEVPAPTEVWVPINPNGTLANGRAEYREEDTRRCGRSLIFVRYVRAKP